LVEQRNQMAKAERAEEEKLCQNAGIGNHIFVPMILVVLALIIMYWEAVKEALLIAIPICRFLQAELQRTYLVFWLFLCNAIIVVLSIESGLLCGNSCTDKYGDSSSFVSESETSPKQQNVLEGTEMGSKEDPGKIECINSISMSITVTQSKQKQQPAKRTRSGINSIRGHAKGRDRDEFYLYESMAQAQALVEYEPRLTGDVFVEYEPRLMGDGSSDEELRKIFDDFIAKVHRQIHSPE